MTEQAIRPWSLRSPRLRWRDYGAVGAGALIACVYIGTGDISIATTMGAKFGFQLWWTYFVLAVAAFAISPATIS